MIEENGQLARPLKHDSIHAELRNQIISGRYPAGTRLPTRAEIERHFGASRFTVQVALDALTREGFVRSRGRAGTMVVDRPPHLHNFAVVFEEQPQRANWTRFLQGIANEATAQDGANGRRMSVHMAAQPHPDNESYQSVVRMVAARRIAGIIFASTPYIYEGTPLLADDGIPRVAIMDRLDNFPVPHQAYLDLDGFFRVSLQRLREMGCRRVAVLTTKFTYQDHGGAILGSCKELGLSCPPYWTHVQGITEPIGVRNLVHLMLRPEQRDRPDGLLVADDNFVESALAGVLAARVNVPEELKVVTHCNFPSSEPAILPVARVGFSASHMMEVCLEILERVRAGARVPRFTALPPVSEQELRPDRL